MNLDNQKKCFKNHVATFTDYGNIKILDFKNPDSSSYRIRFLFEEDYCRLHISGDLGELIATNYNNMTYDKFSDFVNNVDYFKEKIDCCSRDIYRYNEDAAKQQLIEMGNNHAWLLSSTDYEWEDDEDDRLNDIVNDILCDFDTNNGISNRGYVSLCELESDAFEFVSDLGKEETGILDLYMLAFKLAKQQIDTQTDIE